MRWSWLAGLGSLPSFFLFGQELPPFLFFSYYFLLGLGVFDYGRRCYVN